MMLCAITAILSAICRVTSYMRGCLPRLPAHFQMLNAAILFVSLVLIRMAQNGLDALAIM
jgi:hypothetical protein